MPEAAGTSTESAIQELVRDDASRRKFVKLVGTGGAGAFAMFLAACGSSSKSSPSGPSTPAAKSPTSGGPGDVAIVNYALTLEYLEADFYAKVVAAGLVKCTVGGVLVSRGMTVMVAITMLSRGAGSVSFDSISNVFVNRPIKSGATTI